MMKSPVEKMREILLVLSLLAPTFGEYRRILRVEPEAALLKVSSWEELNFYYERLVKEKY